MKDIVIPNQKELEKIKNQLAKDGSSKLHILSDFDKTLTTAFVDGKEIPSLISVLRDESYLTKDYAEKAQELFKKYHPIEINPKIPLDKKKKVMHSWWNEHFDLLIKSGLNKRDLEKVISSDNVKLREGCLEFLDLLHEYEIPLVIMSSSGLGYDAIAMYLKRHNRLYKNIHIISNSYEWDKNENAIGIKKPIIHVLNKDETSIKNYPVFKVIKDRKNVILLGDSLEDKGMVEGFGYKNLIKIGFLNNNVKQNLKYYKKVYDILILNDSGMDYINNLLKKAIKI
ncbi:MAG: hypothetical protein AABX61_01530 [Nanoarchaeota archaeon]